MELRSFKEMLLLTKDGLNAAMAPIRARQVKSKADLEMAKIDAEILTIQTSVQEMCTDKDIDLSRLLDKLDDIALLERRKLKYDEVLKQLFPE